jgi:hypothetical protein
MSYSVRVIHCPCATVGFRATVLVRYKPHAPSSPLVVMPLDIVALPAANVEVLKQRLDVLVVVVEAAEEKAATVRRRVLAARQLLDEEQAAAADLER